MQGCRPTSQAAHAKKAERVPNPVLSILLTACKLHTTMMLSPFRGWRKRVACRRESWIVCIPHILVNMFCYRGKSTNRLGKPLQSLHVLERVLESLDAIFITFSDLCWVDASAIETNCVAIRSGRCPTTILPRRNSHDPLKRSAERAFGFVSKG